ncbi:MAG: hypothetical protein H0U12_06595 [Thermoleophilaceae bacterium]|nr:hypothetical protein [Thermoleophilaceae bacterium]
MTPPAHRRSSDSSASSDAQVVEAGRRSRTVRSVLLSGVAVTFLAACGEDDLARCVDRNTSEIADVRFCDDEAEDGVGGRYLWNFGGSSDTAIGSRVDGGENIDPADQGSISERGGFGANAAESGTGVREVASSGGEEEDSDRKRKSSGS